MMRYIYWLWVVAILAILTGSVAAQTLPLPAKPVATTQGTPQRAPRPVGASTRPSDGNKRSHPAFFQGCQNRVEAMQGKPVDIVFVGDSITANFVEEPTPKWDEVGKAVWDKHYAGRHVLDFGVGADRTEHVLWRLENMEIKQFHPRVAVIMIGTNNTNDTPENIAAGVKAVVDKTREVFGGPKVILVSILPNRRAGGLMADANVLIQKYADGKNVVWFDLASKMTPEGDGWKGVGKDKLHLSHEGYEMWAAGMEPILTDLMKAN